METDQFTRNRRFYQSSGSKYQPFSNLLFKIIHLLVRFSKPENVNPNTRTTHGNGKYYGFYNSTCINNAYKIKLFRF